VKSPAQPASILDRALKPVWFATCAGILSVFIFSLWTPTVDPVMPGGAVLPSAAERFETTGLPQSLNGFVERPLFLPDRRPSATEVPALGQTVVQVTPAEAAREIEGVTLLGVFSSSDASGLILSERGLGKRRLVEGETLQGWTLVGIESRAAIFSDGARTERLEMELMSNLSAPAAAMDGNAGLKDGAESIVSEESSESGGTDDYVPTFENQYESRKRQSAQSEASQDGVPDSEDSGVKK